MKELDVFVITAVDVSADRLTCLIEVMASRRTMPFSIGRLVVESTPGRPDPLGRGWVDPVRLDPTPPVGTPGAVAHGGNSTPARTLVAGAGKSPVFGPVSGK